MNKPSRRLLALFFFLFLSSAQAGSINSATVIADSLLAFPSCSHYEIKGACFWLTDAGAVITTPYVEHFLPDVVVSVFNQPDDNPWLEMSISLDQVGQVAQSGLVSLVAGVPPGGGRHGFQGPLTKTVFFKEVDIVGNPAVWSLPSTPVLLRSVAIPLTPYFQSMLDSVLWRGFPPEAIPEQIYALGADLTRYIGSNVIVWGSLYPYEGKVETSNDAKAAAVIAQRAGNLLTAANTWGHLHQSLPTDCGEQCTASMIQEDDDHTQFQMIYPTLDTSCLVFGKTSTYGEDTETHTNGAYVWVLWRHYSGCIPGEGAFIGKTVI